MNKRTVQKQLGSVGSIQEIGPRRFDAIPVMMHPHAAEKRAASLDPALDV